MGEGGSMESAPIRAAEFFAGIGLVRTALERVKGAQVQVVWANDIKQAKRDAYAANFPDAEDHFIVEDIRNIEAPDLPPGIELATSSFPCIDLSLAGNRRGLVGEQSGMFWEFAKVVKGMSPRPSVILLENVHGFATSHGGKDLTAALASLSELGYSLDVLAVDARHFVPQSRPRMFIVGIQADKLPRQARRGVPPISDVRPAWVQAIHEKHRETLDMHYVNLRALPEGPKDLDGFVETEVSSDLWWGEERVEAFVGSLSEVQKARFDTLLAADTISYRTAYRRTRQGVSTWELRKDAIAGCLRTTGGGSSKQALVRLGRGSQAVRWMTPREYANLMGAHDYKLLAGTPNQQLFGFGDAVVVDVIEWIGNNYLLPVLRPAGPE
ncbi:DNA cytosine methyltransferase [Micromonospora sp. PPF5-17]|uniref:DNA (cytosine-5-)-methyltransferase n=2 Tax=Micromonosporaceae TaxID=28056 RepID=A0ABX9WMS5_9ACTN|nr:DNA cytosine methyltransferase [Micromonospora sp. PPF5-17B]NES34630.1 DNA cytosine methyltransferase [Micromonospora solifontis]NES57006.1 DNA cytosine methyltransferase [Micromonospora sp. PPF5-6]RNM01969.1 DNA (cytosine-5-)-methyltransferase [Micromonospora solifontis]